MDTKSFTGVTRALGRGLIVPPKWKIRKDRLNGVYPWLVIGPSGYIAYRTYSWEDAFSYIDARLWGR